MSAGVAARLHAVVHGYVQGVGFRYFVVRRARDAGLVGWVRNRPDGAVECLAEGPRTRLEWLLDELHRGPRSASVHDIDVDWQAAAGDLRDFAVVC